MFRTLAFLCFPSVLVCVHTPGRYKTSAAAELVEFRKITKFFGNNPAMSPINLCQKKGGKEGPYSNLLSSVFVASLPVESGLSTMSTHGFSRRISCRLGARHKGGITFL